MTQTHHTPGPWEATDSGLIYALAAEGSDELVLICDVGEIEERTPERGANALLIAASPEMLAALMQALEALNHIPRFRVPGLDTDSYAISALCDRAIAKAKRGAA